MADERVRRWLCFDAAAAITAALVMGGFGVALASALVMPLWLARVLAIANAGYGAFSGALSRMRPPPVGGVAVLVRENLAWSCLCALAVLLLHAQLGPLAIAYVLGEAAFVAVLAGFEARALSRARRLGGDHGVRIVAARR